MIDADPTAILNNSLPKVAPTDPPQLPFNNDPTKEDEFVLTTYGPGKIKSSRVEQNAIDNDDHTIDTIFNFQADYNKYDRSPFWNMSCPSK